MADESKFETVYVDPNELEQSNDQSWSPFAPNAANALDRLTRSVFTGGDEATTNTDLDATNSVISFDEVHQQPGNAGAGGARREIMEGSDNEDSMGRTPGRKGGWEAAIKSLKLQKHMESLKSVAGVVDETDLSLVPDVDYREAGLNQSEIVRLRRLYPYDNSSSGKGQRQWRQFMCKQGLRVYVTDLAARGVREVSDLKMLSDEELSKIHRDGMTSEELSRLRKGLVKLEHSERSRTLNKKPSLARMHEEAGGTADQLPPSPAMKPNPLSRQADNPDASKSALGFLNPSSWFSQGDDRHHYGGSLEGMSFEDHARVLTKMKPQDRKLIMEDIPEIDLPLVLSYLTGPVREECVRILDEKHRHALLLNTYKRLSQFESVDCSQLSKDEVEGRLSRLNDLSLEAEAALAHHEVLAAKAAGQSGEVNWASLRRAATSAAASTRSLRLALQNTQTHLRHHVPPRDVLDHLARVRERGSDLLLLLRQMELSMSDKKGGDRAKLLAAGGATQHSLLKSFTQNDLLEELSRRLDAGTTEDCVQKLAIAYGVSSGTGAPAPRAAETKGKAGKAERVVVFSIRFPQQAEDFPPDRQRMLASNVTAALKLKKGLGVSVINTVDDPASGSVAVEVAITGYKSQRDAQGTVDKIISKTSKQGLGFLFPSNPTAFSSALTFGERPSVKQLDMHEGLTAITPPAAPIIVTATPGDGYAKVLVAPPGRGSGSIDSSISEVEVVSKPGGFRAVGRIGDVAVVQGLTNGIKYRFTARAYNRHGWGPYSLPSIEVIPGDETAPPPVPEVASVTVIPASKDLPEQFDSLEKVTASRGRVLDEVEVLVVVPNPGREFLQPVTLVEVQSEPEGIALFAPPNIPITFRNLTPGVEYRFRARVRNANGWSHSCKPTRPVKLMEEADPEKRKRIMQSYYKTNEGRVDEGPIGNEDERKLRERQFERNLLKQGKTPLQVLLIKQRDGMDGEQAARDAIREEDTRKDKRSSTTRRSSASSAGNAPPVSPIQKPATKGGRGRKSFALEEENNVESDMYGRQLRPIDGLSQVDFKFLQRFVGLMAVKGMQVKRHTNTSIKKTILKMDPTGHYLYWDRKEGVTGIPQDTSIDMKQCSKVLRGDVSSWFRSLSIDDRACVTVITPTKRLDVECNNKEDAALLFSSLSVLRAGLQPNILK